MPKKYIRYFNRGLVIGFEVLGGAAVLLFAGWLLLIIRLSQGPMQVNFLTDNIEQALARQQPGFKYDVGATLLTWGGAAQPFIFDMNNVQIVRDDGTPVLSVEKVGIQLSKRYLVFGRLVPRVIRIYSPALRVIRGEEGQFVLNMSDLAVNSGDPEQAEFMKTLLLQMKGRDVGDFLGGLEQVTITDAALFYEDKILGVSWKSRNSDIKLTRRTGGLLVDAIANVEMDQQNQAYIRGSFYYSWQTYKPNGVIQFASFNPSLLAQQSEELKNFSGIDLSLKGSVSFEMDRDFKPGHGRFVLGADDGRVTAPGVFSKPVSVTKFYMQGQFDASSKEMILEQFRADLGGPKLDMAVNIKKQADGRLIQGKAVLRDMPMDRLKLYWPEKLAVDARAWVTGHLPAGTASKATLDMEMLAAGGDFNALTLQKLGGEITFHGIRVDYFPPLMPVTRVSGKAVYDQKSFNLDLTSGALGDMQVTRSKIAITDLDIQDHDTHAKIDIAVSLNGPLRTALQVLDENPLQYAQKLGIQTANVSGSTAVDVGFKFPLYDQLALPEVQVTAEAQLKDVLLKNILPELSLTEGPMALALANGTLTIAADQSPTLLFKGDITPTAFSLPMVNHKKLPGVPGTLDLLVHFKDGKPARITDFALATGGSLLKGDLVFGADGQSLKNVSFTQARLGETDIALEAEHKGRDGYVLTITGRQFDASALLGDKEAALAAPVTPLTISMAVERLKTGQDKYIEKMKMFMRRNNWARIEQLEVDGVSGAKPLHLRYRPVAGGHTLLFEADNAGAALRALGIASSVRGGKLVVNAKPDAKGGPRDVRGLATLTDFSLVGVPVLGMLLNSISLTGIVELLNGEGIAFKKMRAEFLWVDKGPPDSTKNTRTLIIKDGETSGASLGLTFQGMIDKWANRLDMNGTIIPASDLNKLVGIIPLVGNILTGGGKGVFAATYTIKGPTDNPTVTVNPLAVLAPGIFRKLFFEK